MEKEKKLQIIRAAAKRFDRHGLHKTTLDEIARDLRIGKATIYHYFESKDELYFQVLEWEGRLLLEDLKNILINPEITLSEKLELYLTSKENLQPKYKLVYDTIINILEDRSFDRENLFFTRLNAEEEKYLQNYLVKDEAAVIEKGKDLIKLLQYQSWNFLFMKKLNLLLNIEKPAIVSEDNINYFINGLPKSSAD